MFFDIKKKQAYKVYMDLKSDVKSEFPFNIILICSVSYRA